MFRKLPEPQSCFLAPLVLCLSLCLCPCWPVSVAWPFQWQGRKSEKEPIGVCTCVRTRTCCLLVILCMCSRRRKPRRLVRWVLESNWPSALPCWVGPASVLNIHSNLCWFWGAEGLQGEGRVFIEGYYALPLNSHYWIVSPRKPESGTQRSEGAFSEPGCPSPARLGVPCSGQSAPQ